MNIPNNHDSTMRVNVMVEVTPVVAEFKNIIMMMEALISNADIQAYRAFDAEGSMMRLFEAMDHYLAFMLGRVQTNIGFDYYVNEYFAQHARYLTSNHQFMQAAGNRFVYAASYLYSCLSLAQQRIEQVGGMVDEVEYTPHLGYTLGTYLVTGYYNHLETLDTQRLHWGKPMLGQNPQVQEILHEFSMVSVEPHSIY